VVMEVVEAVQEVTLERAGRAEGCFSLPFFAPLGLQVCCPHTYTDFTLRGCIAFPVLYPVTHFLRLARLILAHRSIVKSPRTWHSIDVSLSWVLRGLGSPYISPLFHSYLLLPNWLFMAPIG
jgi:hypothetical protein